MKLPYYETQLLLEALMDISQKYTEDIDKVCDEKGCVRLDVHNDYVPNISRKKSVVEYVMTQIKKGAIEF